MEIGGESKVPSPGRIRVGAGGGGERGGDVRDDLWEEGLTRHSGAHRHGRWCWTFCNTVGYTKWKRERRMEGGEGEEREFEVVGKRSTRSNRFWRSRYFLTGVAGAASWWGWVFYVWL